MVDFLFSLYFSFSLVFSSKIEDNLFYIPKYSFMTLDYFWFKIGYFDGCELTILSNYVKLFDLTNLLFTIDFNFPFLGSLSIRGFISSLNYRFLTFFSVFLRSSLDSFFCFKVFNTFAVLIFTMFNFDSPNFNYLLVLEQLLLGDLPD